MAKQRKILRFCGLLLCIAALVCVPKTSSANADWIVTINTKVIEHCLEYPNSSFKPLIRASVFFEQGLLEPSKEEMELTKRGAEPDANVPQTLYENHYSSHFRAVGLHRYKQLMIKPGTLGTIKVSISNSSFRQEEVNAAANTTVRLILDLYLNKMALRGVTVPRDVFDMFIQELQRYGFRTVNIVPGQLMSGLVMLSVRSEPAGRAQYLSYGI